MEEVIVDSMPDLHVLPAECLVQAGVQGERGPNTGDQAQFPISVQKGCPALSQWPQNRAQRVELLRQYVISGAYRVDSAELAQSIWHNATHFFEGVSR